MSILRQQPTIRDPNPSATHAFRERTAALAPSVSNHFTCAECGQFRHALGSKRLPIANSRHVRRVCAECVSDSKGKAEAVATVSASINAMNEASQ